MNRNQVQYTIRNVPAALDAALRQMALAHDCSLNEITINALRRGTGMAGEPIIFHDLDSLAGTWREDKQFDAAIEAQDQIDPLLWK